MQKLNEFAIVFLLLVEDLFVSKINYNITDIPLFHQL